MFLLGLFLNRLNFWYHGLLLRFCFSLFLLNSRYRLRILLLLVLYGYTCNTFNRCISLNILSKLCEVSIDLMGLLLDPLELPSDVCYLLTQLVRRLS